MSKRLDVSTLAITIKPKQDNANKFMQLLNAAMLRMWLVLNLFALLRQAQRQAEKLPDDGSSLSLQLAIQSRIRKPVQVTQDITQETGPIVVPNVWVTEKEA